MIIYFDNTTIKAIVVVELIVITVCFNKLIHTIIKAINSIEESDLLMTSIQTIENEISQLRNNPTYSAKAEELDAHLKDTISKSDKCQDLLNSLQAKAEKFAGMRGGADMSSQATLPDAGGITDAEIIS